MNKNKGLMLSGLLALTLVLLGNAGSIAWAYHNTPQFAIYEGVHKVGKWGLHHVDVYTNAGKITILTESKNIVNIDVSRKICNPCVFHIVDIPRVHNPIKITDSLGHSKIIPT